MKKIHQNLPYHYHGPYIPLLGKTGFPLQYGLNILYYKKTQHLPALTRWKDIGLTVWMPAFLLLYGVEDASYLAEAKKYLTALAPVTGEDFAHLRTATLYAYGNYYTQRLL